MAEMERHVTNRIDLLAVKLSHDLTEHDGANPLFKVSDGSESVEHYAVLTKRDAERVASRRRLRRRAAFENVLVLWNDDEEAYNVVVDGETVIDRAR